MSAWTKQPAPSARLSLAYATPSPLLPNSIIRQYYGWFQPDSGVILPRKGLLKPFWAAGSGAAASLPACSAVFRTGLRRCFADGRELASSLVILSDPQQISRQCQSSPALRDGSFHTLTNKHRGGAVYSKPKWPTGNQSPVEMVVRALCSPELRLPGGGEHRCAAVEAAAEGL